GGGPAGRSRRSRAERPGLVRGADVLPGGVSMVAPLCHARPALPRARPLFSRPCRP
ncbi:hypothetical protein HMPREF9946_01093, partial [Acetobacteraceae bacterium AT-5844]